MAWRYAIYVAPPADHPLWQAGSLWGTPAGEIAASFLPLPLLVLVVPWGHAWRRYFGTTRARVEAHAG